MFPKIRREERDFLDIVVIFGHPLNKTVVITKIRNTHRPYCLDYLLLYRQTDRHLTQPSDGIPKQNAETQTQNNEYSYLLSSKSCLASWLADEV